MTENQKIFAYGSLMKESSLRKTVPDASHIFPAKVYGFSRVFNLASHYRYCTEKQQPVCVLNLAEQSQDKSMNGICFEMDGDSFDALLSREKIYQLHEVQVVHYLDSSQVFSANLFWAQQFEPYAYLRDSDAQRHYLDLCLSGCRAYGEEFIREFISSTSFWGLDPGVKPGQIWRGMY